MESETSRERARVSSLMEMLPKGRKSALDVGARHGDIALLLVQHFETVTALDLEKPPVIHERIAPVAGDATSLKFPDDSFDTVFSAEVLEHIPSNLLPKACAEIARVARYDVLIGVPYKQDLRLGRSTCTACGYVNPPWGHVNAFDEQKLAGLFGSLKRVTHALIETNKDRTNLLSTLLMDFAGNPWGTYGQGQPCIGCGRKLAAPERRSLPQKVSSRLGHLINRLQQPLISPQATWIHMLFEKRPFQGGGARP